MGYEREMIESNVKKNNHNNTTTTYELLIKKHKYTHYLNKLINTINHKTNKYQHSFSVDIKSPTKGIKNQVSQQNSSNEKDININIINFAAKKIGNINISITNPITCTHTTGTSATSGNTEGKFVYL